MKKNILLGVCGGVAAYKSAELVRLLQREGFEVRVMMTAAAARFVGPLTFQALSGHPVATNLLDADQESAMGHIRLARWPDQILIAPATANFMARIAHGLADDILSAVCLAAQVPIRLAPAMNTAMWLNPATQSNRQVLESRGIRLLGPGQGELACGESGEGRMLNPDEILDRLRETFQTGPLQGQSALVTAGPTREPLDPVRFISNRSSGKMGYALAEALRSAGASVTLVSGPVALPAPQGVELIRVETALQMRDVVMARISQAPPGLFVACAAVADYRPEHAASGKIKKTDANMTLSLTLNPDILTEVAGLPPGSRPFCVGFAAETEDVLRLGEEKRQRKGVDLLAANLVGGRQGGFEDNNNALTLLWADGQAELPMMPKRELAAALVSFIEERFFACNPSS